MTTYCNECKARFPLEDADECYYCENIEYDDDHINLLLCKSCVTDCFCCKMTLCDNCVEKYCSKCHVSMCVQCSYADALCDCDGECFWCNIDLVRDTDGRRCVECDIWGCHDCRLKNSSCKECNPKYKEEQIVNKDVVIEHVSNKILEQH